MKVVLMAGGRGTRISELFPDVPKPLIPIQNMGTPDRYYSVCEDFKKGVVTAKNLSNKQKAIFLDRDS